MCMPLGLRAYIMASEHLSKYLKNIFYQKFPSIRLFQTAYVIGLIDRYTNAIGFCADQLE